MPELRQDPLSGRWVIIATGRAKRPEAFAPAARPAPSPEHDATCCFCPGQEATTPPEVLAYRAPGAAPDSPGWQVRVVPNKFAAFDGATDRQPAMLQGLEQRRPAFGAAEVIVGTPRHDRTLALASDAELAQMIHAHQERYRELAARPGVAYVMLFRNQGAWAGASQRHPHSQIMALPVVPAAVATELDRAAAHHGMHGSCLMCQVIARERAHGARVLADDGRFVLFTPYASRTPFELMIAPIGHQADLGHLSPEDEAGLGRQLGLAMRMLDRALGDPPHNFYLHAAPCGADDAGRWSESYHWHLSILPRLTTPAAFELGSGILINITVPEAAAAFLREYRTEPV
ncbi:MAG: galactose-1-phosphate uridylyltransferase [Candidatus Sericytochromatia bacterium]|nr:galactose-1-phosphate uridylyltransferase [Candidatus Sericytochromatia bacterium]